MKIYFILYIVLQSGANCFQTLRGDFRKRLRTGPNLKANKIKRALNMGMRGTGIVKAVGSSSFQKLPKFFLEPDGSFSCPQETSLLDHHK
jgi:hypothetical protein